MNKKKIIKFIVTILVILLVMFFMFFIRNFVIISKLERANNSFFSSSNYSFKMGTDNNAEYQYYYKDGKYVEIFKLEGEVITTVWYDENKMEQIEVYGEESAKITKTHNKGLNGLTRNILLDCKNINIFDKIKNSLSFYMTTEECDSKTYYVLYPLRGVVSNVYYFNKDNNMISEFRIGQTKVKFYDYNVNNVTEENVRRPDLSLYEIIEN